MPINLTCHPSVRSWFAVLGIACAFPPSLAGARQASHARFVEIRWGGTQASVDTARAVAVVTLPLALKKIIAVKFAGFRVPEDRDYTLDWVELHKKVPFLALDDFNHDGNPDVAMRLKHNQKDDVWKLVIFHGPNFAPVELESSPDPKAEMRNWGAIQGYGLTTMSDCSQPRCLVSYRYESAASVFEWTGKGYRERNISN